VFRVEPTYHDLLRRAGIADAWSVFENPRIRVWRSITERENATLDVPAADGSITRLHIKRDKEPQHESSAGAEAAHLLALSNRGIPTPPLVAYGKLPDGRSFVITEDLHGYAPADRQIAAGVMKFSDLLEPTARLAGRLHASAAFHRDLYLCHFFVRQHAGSVEVRLIDCARVLIKPFWRRRWQIKDLAQFTYSTREHSVPPAELDRWLAVYGAAFGRAVAPSARRMIELKADWIARHDAALRRRQPERNVAIPD
jgi:heptose I phosphotransferase